MLWYTEWFDALVPFTNSACLFLLNWDNLAAAAKFLISSTYGNGGLQSYSSYVLTPLILILASFPRYYRIYLSKSVITTGMSTIILPIVKLLFTIPRVITKFIPTFSGFVGCNALPLKILNYSLSILIYFACPTGLPLLVCLISFM